MGKKNGATGGSKQRLGILGEGFAQRAEREKKNVSCKREKNETLKAGFELYTMGNGVLKQKNQKKMDNALRPRGVGFGGL